MLQKSILNNTVDMKKRVDNNNVKQVIRVILLISLLFSVFFLQSCSKELSAEEGTYEGEYYGGIFGRFRIEIEGTEITGYILDSSAGQAEIIGQLSGSDVRFESTIEVLTLQAVFTGTIDTSTGMVSGTFSANNYTGIFSGQKL